MSPVQWLLAYLLGLLTLPAALAIGAFLFWSSLPDAQPQTQGQQNPAIRARKLERKYAKQQSRKTEAQARDVGANSQARASPYGAKRTGWLRITRSLGASPPEAADNNNAKLSDIVARGFAKWMNNRRNTVKKTSAEGQGTANTPTVGSEHGQDMYYAVLVGDTLVMYDSEAMHECRGVIIMSKHQVSLHHNPDVSESQVYSRRTPIKLSPLDEGIEAGLYKRQVPEYYIYADKPVDKEDWYFALLWSSLASVSIDSSSDEEHGRDGHSAGNTINDDDLSGTGSTEASANGSSTQAQVSGADADNSSDNGGGEGDAANKKPKLTNAERERLLLRMRRSCLIPDQPGIASILDTISVRGAHSGPGKVREDEWLNAMVGRIFLAMYRTEFMRQHFIRKLQSKFDRVQRPIFLDRMVVADLDVGDNAPVITNPKLESFDANGQIDASMYVHYMGGFKVVLNTSVKIGSLRLSIALSVVLESLAGKMLVRFHPAPSNRVWVGFYEMPQIRLKLSPVFMQKQVRYAVISQAIEKQIYDILRISMVLPNMDDTVFFPTPHEDGGILERSLKDYKDAGLDQEADSDDDSEQPVTANRPSSAAAGASKNGDKRAPVGGVSRKEPSGVKPVANSDHNSVLEALQSQTTQRPLSFPLADSFTSSPHLSESVSVKSDIPQARRGSVGNTNSNNSTNQQGIPQYDTLALRKQMVTPKPFNGETTANSSSESLEKFRQQLRDSREKLRESDTESTNRSLSPAPSVSATSIKSSISASAVSFFKRARDSQAAESAKTWWQSIQNNTPADTDAAGGTMPSARASTFQPNAKQQQQHGYDTVNTSLDSNQPVSPRLPPRAAGELSSNHHMTSDGSENAVAENSNGLVFPRLAVETSGASNGGGGGGSSGAASGSNIVYGGRPIVGSAVTGDSSLMRRRPAALDQGEEIALPIHRRYSNSARPGFAAAASSMYGQSSSQQ
ncbi:hypothetical protein IW138_000173 [Coemansia sp. RSA 986]|nr:hypothetical protein IW138_000173 [Coemansia sp. RSA 986]